MTQPAGWRQRRASEERALASSLPPPPPPHHHHHVRRDADPEVCQHGAQENCRLYDQGSSPLARIHSAPPSPRTACATTCSRVIVWRRSTVRQSIHDKPHSQKLLLRDGPRAQKIINARAHPPARFAAADGSPQRVLRAGHKEVPGHSPGVPQYDQGADGFLHDVGERTCCC